VLDPLVAPVLRFFPADLLWLVALLVYDWKTARRIYPATSLGVLGLAFPFVFVTQWVVGIGALQEWLKASVITSAAVQSFIASQATTAA